MPTTIFYFSATGNSLKVAKYLAQELDDAQVVPMVRFMKEDMDIAADKIGMVFPVHSFGIPKIAAQFIEKLKPEICHSKYLFAVVTCGGLAGDTIKHVEARLRDKNLKLSSGFVVKMPGNCITLYSARPEAKQQKMFKEAETKIKKISSVIKHGKSKVERSFFPLNPILSGVIHNSFISHVHSMDKAFWTDDKCTGCGTCAGVCPVDNIVLEDSKPKWKGECTQCLACIQWCPQESIQAGKLTVKRKRYTHPDIKLEEIIS